jgi:hypothetical protein
MRTHHADALTDTAPRCQRGNAISDVIQRAPPCLRVGFGRKVTLGDAYTIRAYGKAVRFPRTQWRLTLENFRIRTHN